MKTGIRPKTGGCAGRGGRRQPPLHGRWRRFGRRRWRRGRRGRSVLPSGELRLQRRNAHLEQLVLLARDAGHVLDRLELLALDQVEIAQPLLGLVLEHGVELALDALGDAGGVIHQAGDFIEEAVGGLGHGSLIDFATYGRWRSLNYITRWA